MFLLFTSFIAGVLTVFAPCTISLLPVIVGGTVSGGTSYRRAIVVATSLGVSVGLFTVLLKVSTIFLSIPQSWWHMLSGGLIILVGLSMLLPALWDRIPFLNRINRDSNALVGTGYLKQNIIGDILIGAALGPVFSSCSPTYFIILAEILPHSTTQGLVYLVAYLVGLCGMLLIVAIASQSMLARFNSIADSTSIVKRTVAAIFIALGIVILTGYDTTLELAVSNHLFDVTTIERVLLSDNHTNAYSGGLSIEQKEHMYPHAPEITNPSGFINTNGAPITISQFKGNKVVLIDFWTYSCINCQRTLPYLKAWYDTYHDQGLEIISIHTPEFAFEKVPANVLQAVNSFGIKYPVVLDNDYGTWNAFGNQYWPREYLIDIDGYVVYDHSGEGNEDATEQAIRTALIERAHRLNMNIALEGTTTVTAATVDTDSPETYFGSDRNDSVASCPAHDPGTHTCAIPTQIAMNKLYFSGTWDVEPEYIVPTNNGARVQYQYAAKSVYLVAGSDQATDIEVLIDGQPIDPKIKGSDVFYRDSKSYVTISGNRLYRLIDAPDLEQHTIELRPSSSHVQLYTFTFG